MNRIRKAIGAAALAVGVVGGSAAVAVQQAPDASAATSCNNAFTVLDRNMCNYAWARANMAPLSTGGINQYGKDWCNIRKVYGSAEATRSVAARIGAAKTNGIIYGADSWYC